MVMYFHINGSIHAYYGCHGQCELPLKLSREFWLTRLRCVCVAPYWPLLEMHCDKEVNVNKVQDTRAFLFFIMVWLIVLPWLLQELKKLKA